MAHVTDAEIIARWDAGEKMAHIADDLGLSRERVRQRLERNGRGGPNYNILPAGPAILEAAADATSLTEVAAAFDLSKDLLLVAVKQHGVREHIDEMLHTNRQIRANQRKLETQRELIKKVRELAVRVQHTPTSRDLGTIGLFPMTLHQAFGSVSNAMVAAGLEPNVAGRPPQPLPVKFGVLAATQDLDSLYEQADQLRRLGMASALPTGNDKPQRAEYITREFFRDPLVVAWVLENAAGVCEACGELGYETDDGTRFLEVHHVVPLADGGSDVPSNAVAVCETCHGKLHRWKHRAIYQRRLYSMIPRLIPDSGLNTHNPGE
jgi:transposase-like protein